MKISDKLLEDIIQVVEEDLELEEICEGCRNCGSPYAFVPKEKYEGIRKYLEQRFDKLFIKEGKIIDKNGV